MKKFVIALMAIMMVAGIAVAEKPVLHKPLAPYNSNGRAAEVEPNDDAATANPLVIGDDMNAAIDPAGDVDFFAIDVLAGDIVDFETHPGDVGDTKLYLYDTDGVTELAYNDDGGTSFYSLISYEFTADGTYYVEVTGYSASTQGTYILTATAPAPPAPGESCGTAIDLIDDDMTNTCPGAEYWYTFTAPFDGLIMLDTCIEGQAIDTYIRVYDACNGEELAYNDDADCEFYNYASYLEVPMTAGQELFILFDDNYSAEPFDFNLYVSDGVVATDNATFDSLKSMYR